jgi:aldose 1-epimerase
MVIELAYGDDRVVVDEVQGGRLVSLLAGGAERLIEPNDDPHGWGSFAMIPWAGRVADARIDYLDIDLEANHGEHAIHGVTYDRSWTVDRSAGNAVELLCPLPRDRWPLGGMAAQRITLTRGCLDLEIQVQAAERGMPVAVGWHPWFRRPDKGDMTVVVDSASVLETTRDMLPTGEIARVSRKLDLQRGAKLGRRHLDHAYVDVLEPVTVTWPDLTLTMELPSKPATVVVYSPAHAVCVEPQTAWPDPFAWPDRSGVAQLGPRDIFSASTRWTWEAS